MFLLVVSLLLASNSFYFSLQLQTFPFHTTGKWQIKINRIIFRYCFISLPVPLDPLFTVYRVAVRWACFHLKWTRRRSKTQKLTFSLFSNEWKIHSIAFKSNEFMFDFAFLLIVSVQLVWRVQSAMYVRLHYVF